MKGKQLMKFCEDNAKDILSREKYVQVTMMRNGHTCVLRQLNLPEEIKESMTHEQWIKYGGIAQFMCNGNPRTDIPMALKAVNIFIKDYRRDKK